MKSSLCAACRALLGGIYCPYAQNNYLCVE